MANKLCLNRSPIKLRLESAQTQTSELFKIKSDLYSFLKIESTNSNPSCQLHVLKVYTDVKQMEDSSLFDETNYVVYITFPRGGTKYEKEAGLRSQK